jgi:hypothetical protein
LEFAGLGHRKGIGIAATAIDVSSDAGSMTAKPTLFLASDGYRMAILGEGVNRTMQVSGSLRAVS